MSNKNIEGDFTVPGISDSESDPRNSDCDLGFSDISGVSPAKKPKPEYVPSMVAFVKETSSTEFQTSLTDDRQLEEKSRENREMSEEERGNRARDSENNVEAQLLADRSSLDKREASLNLREEALKKEEERLKRQEQELLEKEKSQEKKLNTKNTIGDNEDSRIILNLKRTTLPTVDDGKAEIIDIIERVVRNKKRLKALLSDSDGTSRRKIPKTIKDLDLKRQGRDYNYTQRPLEFENAQWDNVTFEHAYFTENTTFRNCSFLQAKFKNCQFGSKNKSTNINFHNCDLICTDFSSSSFIGFVDFNGSDLRCANFRGLDNLAFLITTDSVKIINAEYLEKAQFDEDAWSVIVERSKSFDVSRKS